MDAGARDERSTSGELPVSSRAKVDPLIDFMERPTVARFQCNVLYFRVVTKRLPAEKSPFGVFAGPMPEMLPNHRKENVEHGGLIILAPDHAERDGRGPGNQFTQKQISLVALEGLGNNRYAHSRRYKVENGLRAI